jgi:hypothetical protein
MVSAQCPVLHGEVNRLMDLEGHVERVFCPEYVEAGECRLKREAMTGGPLSQLFERLHEHTLDHRGTRCDLG